jgi:hypothetical protein
MAAINIPVSDQELQELHSRAAVKGKTVYELAAEALRKGLEYQWWQELLTSRGKGEGGHGYMEENIPRTVREWRSDQRGPATQIPES